MLVILRVLKTYVTIFTGRLVTLLKMTAKLDSSSLREVVIMGRDFMTFERIFLTDRQRIRTLNTLKGFSVLLYVQVYYTLMK